MHTGTPILGDGIDDVYYFGKMSWGNALLYLEEGKATGMDHSSKGWAA